MNTKSNPALRRAGLSAAVLLLVTVATAAPPLSLVPSDAAAVGVVHVDQLRSSALSSRLFHEADQLTVDGDASKFLSEASLDPRKDVDTVALALVPVGEELRALVVLEGHFNSDRLGRAIEAQGGLRASAAGREYYRLPEKDEAAKEHPGALAILDSRTLIAGEEAAVTRALTESASRPAGLSAQTRLRREAAKLEHSASAWAVVDPQRTRSWHSRHGGNASEAAGGMGEVLKKMSLMSFEATPEGNAVAVAATGYSSDKETRQDLEDVLRGITAAWRLAAQSKSPEALAMVRKIEVQSNDDTVRVSGRLPVDLLEDHGRR